MFPFYPHIGCVDQSDIENAWYLKTKTKKTHEKDSQSMLILEWRRPNIKKREQYQKNLN